MKFLSQGFAVVVGSAAILTLATGFAPLHAQDAPQPPAATEVDDATLQAFAQASLAIEEVITEWRPRIQQAEDEAEARDLRQEANQEVLSAVQTSGLDIEAYNQVAELAQANPAVASAIERYRNELQ